MEEEPDRIRRAGLRPSAEGGIPSLGRNQKRACRMAGPKQEPESGR